MANGKSIHIGLNFVDPNAYDGWGVGVGNGQLSGCVNDANALKALADSLGYASTILTNSQATSVRVIQEIASAAQTLQGGDILLLTYSGHGGQVFDANGDEADAKDETWVLYDREVIDDELYALWSQFAAGVRVLVLSDSCHSGTVAKMMMADDTQAARMLRRERSSERKESVEEVRWEDTPKALPLDVQGKVNARDREMYNTLQWIAGPAKSANVSASVLLISGCQDNQLSYDGNYYGQFTGTVLQVWDNGTFRGDYKDFHRDILNKMPPEQSPNYMTVGTSNAAFELQKPFTIEPPSAVSVPVSTPSTPTTPVTSRPTLKYGSSGEDVRYLQQRLQEHGYSIIVDGYFGSQTKARVQEFQAANGLDVDGIVGQATWAALEKTYQPGITSPFSLSSSSPASPAQPSTGSTAASSTNPSATSPYTTRPTLKRGDTGDNVVYMQQLLKKHGYNLNGDGVFGPLTESLVRDFQRGHGLTVDGVVGPQTWSALESVPV